MAGPRTRGGVNSVNELFSSSKSVDSTIKDIQTTSPVGSFMRAVVVEVFFDRRAFTESDFVKIEETVSNPEFVRRAPRNSIIGRVISNNADISGAKPRVFLPFFSEHMMLPVKPGEQVWITFEDMSQQTTGFWISRVPELLDIEDVNYTHGDRKFDPSFYTSLIDRAEGFNEQNIVPNFMNGGGSEENFSLNKPAAYEDIINESKAYDEFTPEPVPRVQKRPGDFVVQGSNNTTITLGTDRGSSTITQENDVVGKSGAIDIVAGRAATDIPLSDKIQPSKNGPNVVENARGNIEVDKTPFLRDKTDNLSEGDNDLRDDASRVYIAMNTRVDTQFGVNNLVDFAKTTTEPSPAIVVKTDNVRIIARESVKFIAEGGSEIILTPDGNIFIKPSSSGKVFLGGGPEENTEAAFADVVTYPPSPNGAGGFVGEMATWSKKPNFNFSSKVKVKL